MEYYEKQLADGRWGIYEGDTLLATTCCAKTCQAIIKALKSKRSRRSRVRKISRSSENHSAILDLPQLSWQLESA
ncbi:MAG: hypothetical protein MUC48_01630 [Leptolyngbya sp. Prado105]|jgi:hypothetical protein|nr:hypothetical protein [Leptolyngbya sp. Prado105]